MLVLTAFYFKFMATLITYTFVQLQM